jgi:hypothetical protein
MPANWRMPPFFGPMQERLLWHGHVVNRRCMRRENNNPDKRECNDDQKPEKKSEEGLGEKFVHRLLKVIQRVL